MAHIRDLRARLAVFVLAGATFLLVPAWSAGQPSPWPREGSRVEYDLHWSFTAPDGSYHVETAARLVLDYDGELWSGTCSGATTEVVDGVAARTSWSSPSGGSPAMAPARTHRGATVLLPLTDDPAVAEGCRHSAQTVEVAFQRRQTWSAEEPPETSAYQDVAVTWDRPTGLVLEWSCALRNGSSSGRLAATDGLAR